MYGKELQNITHKYHTTWRGNSYKTLTAEDSINAINNTDFVEQKFSEMPLL